jgi:hypothetical protein
MSLLRQVIRYVAGSDAIRGSGNIDETSFTGTNIEAPVSHTMATAAASKTTTGIQVGVSTTKAEKQEKMRQLRLTKSIQRLRATVAAQARARAQAQAHLSSVSRLTSDSEDYHTGKIISKLFKREKKIDAIAEEHTCCVCLDTVCLGNTNMTRTGCGHVFHTSCLLKSLRVKNTCPMCRWELEDRRPNQQTPNVLTPVSAEQIITEEISYFPNAAHAQSIMLSRHPKRRLKELLRVFGFTLLRTVAEYVHEDNIPVGWYDDGETTDDSEDSDASNDDNGEGEASDNEGDTEDDNEGDTEGDNEDDNEDDNEGHSSHPS